jgi:hypothetical protein
MCVKSLIPGYKGFASGLPPVWHNSRSLRSGSSNTVGALIQRGKPPGGKGEALAFEDVLGLLAAAIVVVLPGVALLLALRVRRPLMLLGLAAPASIGVATITASLSALVGLPFGAVTLGVVTAVLLGLGVLWWWRARGSRAATRTPRWHTAGTWAGIALVVIAFGYGIASWMVGLGSLGVVPQEHDTIVHSELVAYIFHTGRGAPWQVLPVDFLTGTPTSYYPSGMHLLGAAVADLTGDALVGLNAVTVILLTVGLAASVAALAYVAVRATRAGETAAVLGAGVAAVIAVGMNSPTINLAEMGGILANASAMALAPGVIAALLSLRRRDWPAAVAVGVGCAGLVAAHPSSVATVGVTLVAWWIGTTLNRGGLRKLRDQLPSLAATAGTAAVVAAPVLAFALTAGDVTSAWPPDFRPRPFDDALGDAVGLPFWGYLVQYDGRAQVAVFALVLLGIGALLMLRRGFGPLVAYGVWVVIVVGAYVSPERGFEAPITGFFYNAMLRIRGHVNLLVPVLAALGVVLTTRAVAVWLRRRQALRRRVPMHTGWVAVGLAVAVMAVYLAVPGRHYARISAEYLATRYARPDLFRFTEDDQAAIDFLASRVRPGERVMNSANDGSSYLYVEKNIPIVNNATLGIAKAPYTYQLLEKFNRYPTDDKIRQQVLDLNIRWVYVDEDPPTIGDAFSPEDWAGGKGFSFAPGLDDLDDLPGLTEEFRSGPVHVYRLDQDVLRDM